MELNEILDKVEQRYKRRVVFGECHIKDDSVHADIFVDEAMRDVPALVKALRGLWDEYTDEVGRGTNEEYYLSTVNDESANLAAILSPSQDAREQTSPTATQSPSEEPGGANIAESLAMKNGPECSRAAQGSQGPAAERAHSPTELWTRYLQATGRLAGYNAHCDCISCQATRAGYGQWRAQQQLNQPPDSASGPLTDAGGKERKES